MLTLEKKEKMIRLYLKGLSYTDIAKEIGMTRQTVSKYIKQYEKDQKALELATTPEEKEQIIIRSSAKPKYDSSKRQRIKLTPDVESIIDSCLEENKQKIQQGKRKLVMKNTDINSREPVQSLPGNGFVKEFQEPFRLICLLMSISTSFSDKSSP